MYFNSMFAVKIVFKGKTILLGKGIESFQKITSEIQIRFPGQIHHGIYVRFQGDLLEDFSQVKKIMETSPIKSIKLEVEPRDKPIEQKKEILEKLEDKPKEEEEKKQNSFLSQEKQQNSFVSAESQQKAQISERIQAVRQQSVEIKKQSLINDSFLSSELSEDKPFEQEEQNQVLTIENENGIIIKPTSSFFAENEDAEKKQEINQQKILNNSYENSLNIQRSQQKQILSENKQLKEEGQPQLRQTLLKESEFKDGNQSQIKETDKSQLKEGNQSEIKKIQYSEYGSEIKVDNIKQCELYRCFYCEGFGLCKVCKSTGKLNENSQFMKLIDTIVDRKIESKLRVLQETIEKALLLEGKLANKCLKIEGVSQIKVNKMQQSPFSSKISEKQEKIQSQFKLKQVDFEMKSHLSNPKVVEPGQEFSLIFVVGEIPDVKHKYEMNIMDEKTGATMPIEFKTNAQVKVGPFKCGNEDKLQKIFRIFYFDENSDMQFIGSRFGCVLLVEKEQKVKQLVSNFRIKIEGIKKSYKINKDTEYIVQRLKDLGINEENYEENMDLIPDIIQTL